MMTTAFLTEIAGGKAVFYENMVFAVSLKNNGTKNNLRMYGGFYKGFLATFVPP